MHRYPAVWKGFKVQNLIPGSPEVGPVSLAQFGKLVWHGVKMLLLGLSLLKCGVANKMLVHLCLLYVL